MLSERGYECELAKIVGELMKHEDHTDEELDAIGRNTPIRVLQDGKAICRYCADKGLSLNDTAAILAWVFTLFPFLNDLKVSNDVTYDEAREFCEAVRVNTIVIHRLNYFMHCAMLDVYDVLDREGRLRFAVKREMKNAEKVWNRYLSSHRLGIDQAAWSTLDDHLRLAYDAVSPYVERVYETVRDYMIRLGMRDVELLARCQVALLMIKVCGHSFKVFFEDFKRESGIDFTKYFIFDDLSIMGVSFVSMCNAVGIRTEKDQYGYDMIKEFNPEENNRFLSAWDKLIKTLRDNDLMDEVAVKAIGLNPTVKEDYEKNLKEIEREQLNVSIGQLSDKFKVSKL